MDILLIVSLVILFLLNVLLFRQLSSIKEQQKGQLKLLDEKLIKIIEKQSKDHAKQLNKSSKLNQEILSNVINKIEEIESLLGRNSKTINAGLKSIQSDVKSQKDRAKAWYGKTQTAINFIPANLAHHQYSRLCLVMSMQKTGSQTIHEAVLDNLDDIYAYHTHGISKEALSCIRNGNIETEHLKDPHSKSPLERWTKLRSETMGYLEKLSNPKTPKPYIISSFREPIKRELSLHFQHYDKDNKRDIDLSELLKKAKESLLYKLENGFYESWFETEIKENFDIDVFGENWNHEKNYLLFESPKAKLLLLKLDSNSFSSRLTQGLSELSGNTFSNPSHGVVNQSKDKHYKELYKEASQLFKLTHHEFEKVENNKFVQNFFTDMEISELKSRWCN